MQQPTRTDSDGNEGAIRLHSVAPPIAMPSGYVGPAWLPGTGRMIWWTGRVAIGLRHEPPPPVEVMSESAGWVQALVLLQ